jgi:hypothetical protein
MLMFVYVSSAQPWRGVWGSRWRSRVAGCSGIAYLIGRAERGRGSCPAELRSGFGGKGGKGELAPESGMGESWLQRSVSWLQNGYLG